tara:strand:+ start:279 stop:539 length:261 start_codon:yes stop_codon:yes gene_type:complete
MDNYITNDPNNPINWNGKDIKQCNVCQNDLNTTEEEEEEKCFKCIEEEEERKELEKQFLKFPELEIEEGQNTKQELIKIIKNNLKR